METEVVRVPEIFGSMVFNDTAMKDKLPMDVYVKLKETVKLLDYHREVL